MFYVLVQVVVSAVALHRFDYRRCFELEIP